MRKVILGIWIMMATALMAREEMSYAPQWSSRCDSAQRILDLPDYYCPCMEASTPFAFPYEAEVNDTAWFTATLNDLRRGISAYWFSDCSVTMEVYAFCTSKEPTITLTVGPNQMRDISVEKINKKIEEMGDLAAAAEKMTPHIRVYPNDGGSGRVYCHPYNQGPHSTCTDPIPLRAGMTYVCSKPENAYRMEWTEIAESGKAFIAWKQKYNNPCEIWLTLDSCTGKEIGRTVLSDTLHVYLIDSAQLITARQEERPLWLHALHAKDVAGRLFVFNDPVFYVLDSVKREACYGQTITGNMRTYSSDTAFTDTTWAKHNVLTLTDVQLTFTQPEMEYDTVCITPGELSRGLIYNGYVLREYTDTILEVRAEDACIRRIQLSIISPEGYEYIGAAKGQNRKVLQNGQLFIYVDDRRYNVFGQATNE